MFHFGVRAKFGTSVDWLTMGVAVEMGFQDLGRSVAGWRKVSLPSSLTALTLAKVI